MLARQATRCVWLFGPQHTCVAVNQLIKHHNMWALPCLLSCYVARGTRRAWTQTYRLLALTKLETCVTGLCHVSCLFEPWKLSAFVCTESHLTVTELAMAGVGPRVPKDDFMKALGLDPSDSRHEGYYRAMRVSTAMAHSLIVTHVMAGGSNHDIHAAER